MCCTRCSRSKSVWASGEKQLGVPVERARLARLQLQLRNRWWGIDEIFKGCPSSPSPLIWIWIPLKKVGKRACKCRTRAAGNKIQTFKYYIWKPLLYTILKRLLWWRLMCLEKAQCRAVSDKQFNRTVLLKLDQDIPDCPPHRFIHSLRLCCCCVWFMKGLKETTLQTLHIPCCCGLLQVLQGVSESSVGSELAEKRVARIIVWLEERDKE